MTEQKEHLQALSDIRSMMERSSRFISLSGLSGVFAGVFALCGAAFAYKLMRNLDLVELALNRGAVYMRFILVAAFVMAASVTTGVFLTIRNSRKKGIKIWDTTSKRLLINLMIPLGAGGAFCFILLYHGLIGLIAPATLLFYGLALINASKYTLNDIRYLGICEVVLGLLSSIYIGYGLYFWSVGFGVLHIIYGSVMYFKYERN